MSKKDADYIMSRLLSKLRSEFWAYVDKENPHCIKPSPLYSVYDAIEWALKRYGNAPKDDKDFKAAVNCVYDEFHGHFMRTNPGGFRDGVMFTDYGAMRYMVEQGYICKAPETKETGNDKGDK